MTFFFSEFFLLCWFVFLAGLLSVVILALALLLVKEDSYGEKVSAYECGFDPFDDARNQFDIRFYLVAILFLVFDLETSFLFPWAVCLGDLGTLGFWSIFDFIFELLIGFLYVWQVGSLEWLFFSVCQWLRGKMVLR